MTRDASNRIRDHFTAGSCDLTPASARHATHVLYAPMSHDLEVVRHCPSVLSDAERQRAGRFGRADDRIRFEQRRAFRRFCAATALGSSQLLSEMVFERTRRGRPTLRDAPDLWFSFSSSGSGLLGAWSSTHGLGVDLEEQTRDLEAGELARQFFSIAEARSVEAGGGKDRLRTFYRFWTLKEAALKSIGEGLSFGLDVFEFELVPSPRVVHAPPEHGGPERFSAYAIEGTDSCAALVIRSWA